VSCLGRDGENPRRLIGVIASGKLEKGGRGSNSETFHATLRVNESRPAELGQRPEASLAWGRATVTAKRSESQCRAIEPRNLLLAGATVVDTSGGRAETPQRPGVLRSYRGPRTGRRDMRVAREPERPCRFRGDCRPGFRLNNSRLIRSSCPELAGTKRGRNDGIAKRRQRSAAKWAAGSRSVP
jgi:hypothetical protein